MMNIDSAAKAIDILKQKGITDLNLNIPFKSKDVVKARELQEELRAAGLSVYLEKDDHYYELYIC